jgi:hypothetical protein
MTEATARDKSGSDQQPVKSNRETPLHRSPPPMRVVTKGWWTVEERQTHIEELEKEVRDERKQA